MKEENDSSILVYRLKAGILYPGLSDQYLQSSLHCACFNADVHGFIPKKLCQGKVKSRRWASLTSWRADTEVLKLMAYWETSQLGHVSHYTLAARKNSRLSQLLENAGRVVTLAGTDLSARDSSVAQITGTDLSARGSLVDPPWHLQTESTTMFYTLN